MNRHKYFLMTLPFVAEAMKGNSILPEIFKIYELIDIDFHHNYQFRSLRCIIHHKDFPEVEEPGECVVILHSEPCGVVSFNIEGYEKFTIKPSGDM